MATNIPPHNITEVIDGALHVLRNPDCTIDELIELIPAPDFPTAGIIYGVSGVRDGYRTGRGRVVMRAKTHFAHSAKDGGRIAIIVDELPFQVNKKSLLERIAENVRDKKLDGISDIRDESDKSGMRVVIELKRGEVPEVVLNNLYKQTQLQDTFGMNMVALVDGQPKLLNLKQMLQCFLSHRREVVTRRTVFEESDKSGMRVVIELKRGEVPEVVLNNLYKQTQLQDTFGMNMVALVDGQPKLLNLKQMLQCFLSHRREVVTRRTVFELRKARERGHVLEGLAVALANIDDFIAIIKAAPTPPIAKVELMAKAWDSSVVREMLARTGDGTTPGGVDTYRPENLPKHYGMQTDGLYKLSDDQAQEILQMRLQRLTGLEQDKIVNEYKDVMEHIADLLDILAKPERVTVIITDEMTAAKNEYGVGNKDVRRSQIELNATDLETEDLITPQDMVVTLSHTGYMKAQPISEYRAQKRGGRGKQAMATKEEDWIDQLFIANTHDYILCFSDRGRMYWLKVWEVPQGSRNSRGKPIVNMFPLQDNEKITVILPLSGENRTFPEDHYVFMSTSLGTVKKTPLKDFSNPRKAGIIAVDLDDGDFLIGAALTDGQHDVMLFSDSGKAVRFDENDVRPMGRTARGVRGMNLEEGQHVIALLVAENEQQSVLTATENGYGKRTPITEYTRHGRGTKGMIAIQTSERNGKVVAATLVDTSDEIMLITTGGVLIRTRVSEIREMGRATQGVTLIAVEDGTKLSGLQRVVETDIDEVELTTEADAAPAPAAAEPADPADPAQPE